MSRPYGKELIIDLWDADPKTFTRDNIERFLVAVCERIDMKPEDLHFWDYGDFKEAYDVAPDHLKGTSAVQFITTSNITIHTLDVLQHVYINVFSCKAFEVSVIETIAVEFFGGRIVSTRTIDRR